MIKEVFPEDTMVTQKIRQSLEQLRRLIEKLVDSAQRYEKYGEQLTHLVNPSHLIISKVLPKTIASLFTPNAEERGKYTLSLNAYEEFSSVLDEIEKVFEKSQLPLPHKAEIETLKKGLSYIFDLSELSEAVLLNINSLLEKEIEDIAEDDRENSQKIEQRKKLINAVKGALEVLREFDAAKDELSQFNVTVSSKELVVSGHKLRIENQFELTKEALVEAINKCLKSDKRISYFDELRADTIFKANFSERPKVKDYMDFVGRVYSDINGKNKRFLLI